MGYAIRMGVVAMVAVLAGCGGGGSSSSSPSGDPSRVSFDAMRNGLLALDQELAQANSVIAPTQGRATYNGYMSGGRSADMALNDPEFASRVQLRANFDRQTMDGRFYQFADKDNNSVQGELTLSDGQIDGRRFEADVAGRLTDSNGTRIRVSGETDGGFYGAGAAAVVGSLVVSDVDHPDSGLIGAYIARK